jgi:hypothetical protein
VGRCEGVEEGDEAAGEAHTCGTSTDLRAPRSSVQHPPQHPSASSSAAHLRQVDVGGHEVDILACAATQVNPHLQAGSRQAGRLGARKWGGSVW